MKRNVRKVLKTPFDHLSVNAGFLPTPGAPARRLKRLEPKYFRNKWNYLHLNSSYGKSASVVPKLGDVHIIMLARGIQGE